MEYWLRCIVNTLHFSLYRLYRSHVRVWPSNRRPFIFIITRYKPECSSSICPVVRFPPKARDVGLLSVSSLIVVLVIFLFALLAVLSLFIGDGRFLAADTRFRPRDQRLFSFHRCLFSNLRRRGRCGLLGWVCEAWCFIWNFCYHWLLWTSNDLLRGSHGFLRACKSERILWFTRCLELQLFARCLSF